MHTHTQTHLHIAYFVFNPAIVNTRYCCGKDGAENSSNALNVWLPLQQSPACSPLTEPEVHLPVFDLGQVGNR